MPDVFLFPKEVFNIPSPTSDRQCSVLTYSVRQKLSQQNNSEAIVYTKNKLIQLKDNTALDSMLREHIKNILDDKKSKADKSLENLINE